MNINELRVGNWVFDDDSIPSKVSGFLKEGIYGEFGYNARINLHFEDGGIFDDYVIDVNNISPIKVDSNILQKCGFKHIPRFTVTNCQTLDIGRGRSISIGDVENCNQMMFLRSSCDNQPRFMDDLVCVHNYGYDGWLYLHKLQNLYFALTGEELNYTPYG